MASEGKMIISKERYAEFIDYKVRYHILVETLTDNTLSDSDKIYEAIQYLKMKGEIND